MAVGQKLIVSVIGRTKSPEGVELPESVLDENQRPKLPSIFVLQMCFFATGTFHGTFSLP